MKEYTLTLRLTDDQQRQLEALTAAWNERTGAAKDSASMFDTVMQTGISHTIDERLTAFEQLLKNG